MNYSYLGKRLILNSELVKRLEDFDMKPFDDDACAFYISYEVKDEDIESTPAVVLSEIVNRWIRHDLIANGKL